MIRYVVSRFQQRLTAVNIRAYASKGNAPKVLVPRIPQPHDEVASSSAMNMAEMKPPLLPPCPHKPVPAAPQARTTPYPKAPDAAKARPKPEPQSHTEHYDAGHDGVVNNIGGAEINLLHH